MCFWNNNFFRYDIWPLKCNFCALFVLDRSNKSDKNDIRLFSAKMHLNLCVCRAQWFHNFSCQPVRNGLQTFEGEVKRLEASQPSPINAFSIRCDDNVFCISFCFAFFSLFFPHSSRCENRTAKSSNGFLATIALSRIHKFIFGRGSKKNASTYRLSVWTQRVANRIDTMSLVSKCIRGLCARRFFLFSFILLIFLLQFLLRLRFFISIKVHCNSLFVQCNSYIHDSAFCT